MSSEESFGMTTLPKLLERNAQQDPEGAGIREKTRGVWQTYSWAAYRDNVRDFALGLASLGFGRGDKLSVIGDNRPQLYFAQLSAQVVGGVSVPVYQDSIASELVYVLNHAETSVIVAEDQEQVDKALSLNTNISFLREISIGLIIIAFLMFEPDGLAHRWRQIKTYWKLYPFSH